MKSEWVLLQVESCYYMVCSAHQQVFFWLQWELGLFRRSHRLLQLENGFEDIVISLQELWRFWLIQYGKMYKESSADSSHHQIKSSTEGICRWVQWLLDIVECVIIQSVNMCSSEECYRVVSPETSRQVVVNKFCSRTKVCFAGFTEQHDT